MRTNILDSCIQKNGSAHCRSDMSSELFCPDLRNDDDTFLFFISIYLFWDFNLLLYWLSYFRNLEGGERSASSAPANPPKPTARSTSVGILERPTAAMVAFRKQHSSKNLSSASDNTGKLSSYSYQTNVTPAFGT